MAKEKTEMEKNLQQKLQESELWKQKYQEIISQSKESQMKEQLIKSEAQEFITQFAQERLQWENQIKDLESQRQQQSEQNSNLQNMLLQWKDSYQQLQSQTDQNHRA